MLVQALVQVGCACGSASAWTRLAGGGFRLAGGRASTAFSTGEGVFENTQWRKVKEM